MLKSHYEIVSPSWFDYSIETAEVYSNFGTRRNLFL